MMRQNGLQMSVSNAELSRMVRSGMMRLFELQRDATGDWGWWENGETDSWMTAYAIYGLGVAHQQGYVLSQYQRERIRSGAKTQAGKIIERLDRPSSKDSKRAGYVAEQLKTLAFLLYGLAQADEREIVNAYRNRLNPDKMDAEGLAYLILMHKTLGNSNPEAEAKLDRLVVAENGMRHWRAEQNEAVSTGDDLTATAAGLRALIAVNRNDPRIPSILRWLMHKRTDHYWESTRDTAWVLMAFADYLGSSREIGANGTVALTLNGTPLQTFSLNGDLSKEKEIAIRIGANQLKPNKNEIRLERTGGGTVPIFYAIDSRQTVTQDELPAVTNAGIKIQREYRRLLTPKRGDTTWSERTEATENQMTTGDKIRVKLSLTIPNDMAYVLIEDPFPSGCDPMERGDASEMVEEWQYWYDGVTVRDDRIAFFVRDLPKGTYTLEYNLRAQTSGTCGALPTLLQAMYVPELKAESRSDRIVIRRAER
jgi:alpha-2-macroglobulin